MKKNLKIFLMLVLALSVLVSTAVPALAADLYVFHVNDENGNGVAGARLQVCSDEQCKMLMTDENGVAAFDGAAGVYEVHLIKCPGYTFDKNASYETEATPSTMTITVTSEAASKVAGSEKDAAADKATAAEAADTGYVLSFTTTDINGNEVTSADLFAQNEITMVNLWESWCGPCKSELGDLEKLYEAYQDQGFGIVGVVVLDEFEDFGGKTSDYDEVVALMEENGTSYPIVRYTEELFEIDTYSRPTTVFVDSEGKIIVPADSNTMAETRAEVKASYMELFQEMTDEYNSGALDAMKDSEDPDEADYYEAAKEIAALSQEELEATLDEAVEAMYPDSDYAQITGSRSYEDWVAILQQYYSAAFGKELA